MTTDDLTETIYAHMTDGYDLSPLAEWAARKRAQLAAEEIARALQPRHRSVKVRVRNSQVFTTDSQHDMMPV